MSAVLYFSGWLLSFELSRTAPFLTMHACYFDNQGENAISILEKKKKRILRRQPKGSRLCCHPIFLPQMQLHERMQRKAWGEIPPPRERGPWNMCFAFWQEPKERRWSESDQRPQQVGNKTAPGRVTRITSPPKHLCGPGGLHSERRETGGWIWVRN